MTNNWPYEKLRWLENGAQVVCRFLFTWSLVRWISLPSRISKRNAAFCCEIEKKYHWNFPIIKGAGLFNFKCWITNYTHLATLVCDLFVKYSVQSHVKSPKYVSGNSQRKSFQYWMKLSKHLRDFLNHISYFWPKNSPIFNQLGYHWQNFVALVWFDEEDSSAILGNCSFGAFRNISGENSLKWISSRIELKFVTRN